MNFGSKDEKSIKLWAFLVYNDDSHTSPLGFILSKAIGRIIWCELLHHSKA